MPRADSAVEQPSEATSHRPRKAFRMSHFARLVTVLWRIARHAARVQCSGCARTFVISYMWSLARTLLVSRRK